MIKLSSILGKDIEGYIEVLERLTPFMSDCKVLKMVSIAFDYYVRKDQISQILVYTTKALLHVNPSNVNGKLMIIMLHGKGLNLNRKFKESAKLIEDT